LEARPVLGLPALRASLLVNLSLAPTWCGRAGPGKGRGVAPIMTASFVIRPTLQDDDEDLEDDDLFEDDTRDNEDAEDEDEDEEDENGDEEPWQVA
jgi:hypothetical protein